MTKDQALDSAMKEYAQTHYPDDCKAFKRGYEAGYGDASTNRAWISERNFCERCGKRRGGDVNYIHTCTPPARGQMFDYGDKIDPDVYIDKEGKSHANKY